MYVWRKSDWQDKDWFVSFCDVILNRQHRTDTTGKNKTLN